MSTRLSEGGAVDCVFLSCFDHDVRFFASMLGQARIRVHHASTLEMADFLLLATRGTVLVLDPTFLDGSWRDAQAMIRQFHPHVVTLICADYKDRDFVACARDAGILDVLWRPVGVEQLRSSIWTAYEISLEREGWREEQRQIKRPIVLSDLR
jgi:DNA-binding NtrC family response regulator